MEPTNSKRKFAAILAIDLGTYRGLYLGPDEPEWEADIPSHWNEVVDPRIAKYHGCLVERIGDGALANFASALDAARCAVAIQNAMAERNGEMPVRRRLGFQIGINLCDLTGDRHETHGFDIRVAVRLMSSSPVGGITVSQGVYSHAKNLPDLRFEDLGEQRLAGFRDIVRMRLYRVQLG